MNYSDILLIGRVLKHGRKYWKHILGVFTLSLFSAPIVLLGPYPLKLLVDAAFGTRPVPHAITYFFPGGFEFTFTWVIIIVACLVILIELLSQLHGFLNWVLVTYTGEKLVLSFRTQLFYHVQRLSLAYHDKVGISDSLYRIQYDSTAIRGLLISGISPIISSVFSILAMLYVITLIDWHFVLITIAIVPILILLTSIANSRLNNQWSHVKNKESSVLGILHETLSALRVVKAFGREMYQQQKFVGLSTKLVKEQMKVAYISALFDFLIGMILAMGTALYIFIGSRYVVDGRISLGELLLLMAYLAKVFGPLQNLNKHFNSLQSSLVSIKRAFTLIDQANDVNEIAGAVPIQRISGSIIFDKVSFAYSESHPILQDITFEIKAGQRIGIMGATGSGKTTLLNLLCRFYEPSSGNIVVDGRNINEYKVSDYRSLFSIVLQDPVLFSSSIEENIAYGKFGADKDEIYNAADNAHAHDFITSLPMGYHTEVGERGMQLSGGERQRISIARAFLKNSPILILDEPTSSVDLVTESIIMEATKRLMENKTTFLVTHKLDTLAQCDIIIHLEKGKILDFIYNDQPDVLEKKIRSFKQDTIPFL